MAGQVSDARPEPDDEGRLRHADTYEWQHSLSQIVQALLDAGLILTSLAEYRSIPWQPLPQMIKSSRGLRPARRQRPDALHLFPHGHQLRDCPV